MKAGFTGGPFPMADGAEYFVWFLPFVVPFLPMPETAAMEAAGRMPSTRAADAILLGRMGRAA